MRIIASRGFDFVLWYSKNNFHSDLLLNQSQIKYSTRFGVFPPQKILQVDLVHPWIEVRAVRCHGEAAHDDLWNVMIISPRDWKKANIIQTFGRGGKEDAGKRQPALPQSLERRRASQFGGHLYPNFSRSLEAHPSHTSVLQRTLMQN